MGDVLMTSVDMYRRATGYEPYTYLYMYLLTCNQYPNLQVILAPAVLTGNTT